MKYILVNLMKKITGYRGLKQEDFEKLDCDNFDAGSIEDYNPLKRSVDYRGVKVGWDVNGLHFVLWEKVTNFFKEKGIAYKVMEL